MSTETFCVICKDFNPKLRYFHVPTNVNRRQQWSNKLKGLQLKLHSKICEKHFLKQHIVKSIKFNCLQLTKDATPKLEPSTNLDDYISISNKITQPIIKQTCQRNVGVQTGIKDAGICAFVTVAQNFMVYNVHCFSCDASFSIRNWDKFMRHVQEKHRDFDNIFDDFGVSLEDKCTKEENVEPTMAVTEHENVEQMEIEAAGNYEESQDEQKSVHSQMSDSEEKGWLKEDTEFINLIDWDKESSSQAENIESDEYHKNVSTKYKHSDATKRLVLCVETSDPVFICGLLDLLESYPSLWFLKFYGITEKAFLNLLTKFNEKFELELTYDDMRRSLHGISSWYQHICKENKFGELSYPQSEYYKKCRKFLPDEVDGISCIECGCIMPDHLQYFAHRKLQHPESMSAQDELDEKNSKFQGIPRNEINIFLLVRYRKEHKKRLSYECQVCNRCFFKKHSYVDHIKKHLNIRDFVCDICGTAFVRQIGLHSHKKRHFGLLKSFCRICNKSFNDAWGLSQHRQRCHRPIEGTIEEIEANILLKSNRKSGKSGIVPKNKERPYICELCGNDYKHAGSLDKHIRLHHKDFCKPRAKKHRKIKPPRKKRTIVEKIEYRN